MNYELLNAGVELMLVGMGIVFTFLALLVGLVNVISSALQRYAPDPIPETSQVAPRLQSSDPPPAVIAAITTALHAYRAKH